MKLLALFALALPLFAQAVRINSGGPTYIDPLGQASQAKGDRVDGGPGLALR